MCVRVLHVVGSMDRGGAETLIMNLYRKMDREKIQFDFAVHSPKAGDYDDEIKGLGGKIYAMPHYGGVNHFPYRKAWERFFQGHPEYSIIHGHIRSTAAIYLRIARKYGFMTIAHSHGTSSRGSLPERIAKSILQYPIRHTADYFFACSEKAGRWLFGKKACQSRRFFVLNNAIDSSKFVFSEETRRRKREELGVGQQFVVGHVGNFDPVKNHAFLIDVLECACRKERSCTLLLAGSGNNALQHDMEEKVRRMGLEGNVRFLGKRTDIDELLNAFDVFVFPSLHEGLGIVALEAQANGLQCVLSDTLPPEVAVTDNIAFVSLKKPAGYWADLILSYKNNYIRTNMQECIANAGYDINNVAEWLSAFYLDLQDKAGK